MFLNIHIDTAEHVFKDHPMGHTWVASQSLVTGSITLKYRIFCQEYLVFQGRWSFMAVVYQGWFHCTWHTGKKPLFSSFSSFFSSFLGQVMFSCVPIRSLSEGVQGELFCNFPEASQAFGMPWAVDVSVGSAVSMIMIDRDLMEPCQYYQRVLVSWMGEKIAMER